MCTSSWPSLSAAGAAAAAAAATAARRRSTARRATRCSGLDRIPFIAITGYAQAVDRQRTAHSGFRGHLAKPVDVHVVDEMIRDIRAAHS
jgi:CheY-like chemotaxis protein